MATINDIVVLAAVEATKGVDAAPTGANAIRVTNRPWPKVDGKPIDRAVVKQTLGNLPHLMNPNASVQVEITCELKGSGTAGTAPEYDPLLQACRLVRTAGAGSVAYNPSSAAASERSATVYIYADGLLWKLVGAVGDAKLNAQIGQVPTITFTLSAPYAAPAASALPTGLVYDATAPEVVSSAATFTVAGGAVNAGSFDLSLGNNVEELTQVGRHEFVVTNRAPEITTNRRSVGTAAEWNALMNAMDAAIHFQNGATAGNTVTIDAPAARRKTIGYGEQGLDVMQDVAFGLYEATSDDQFTVTFA